MIGTRFGKTALLPFVVLACASENTTGFGTEGVAMGPAAGGSMTTSSATSGETIESGGTAAIDDSMTAVDPTAPAPTSDPLAPDDSTAAGGSTMTATGGTGNDPAAACPDGFAAFGDDCVKADALCGDTVCGVRQTCQNNACVGEDGDLIVVETENFAVRLNPGNVREWYRVDSSTVDENNNTTGYPCIGDYHCEDTSGTVPSSRSGDAYIEILPDTRRTHGDRMLTYCLGKELSCADPEIKEDDDLAVVSGFPGYQGTTDHTDAEFYPIPGDGPAIGYKVHFTKPGQYIVWGMGGRTTSEGNSIHVGLNGEWSTQGRGLIWCANGWNWSSNRRADGDGKPCGSPKTITIDVPAAGVHTVWFSMREDGFQFDKWIASPSRDYQPRGIDQPESGRIELAADQPAPMPAMP